MVEQSCTKGIGFSVRLWLVRVIRDIFQYIAGLTFQQSAKCFDGSPADKFAFSQLRQSSLPDELFFSNPCLSITDCFKCWQNFDFVLDRHP
nr:MAG TPA: hypothetical protein [Caudoviricetes sp.]